MEPTSSADKYATISPGSQIRVKRRRTKETVATHSMDGESKRCLFDKLPYELLAEIFILTESPDDVLAMARSSKFFCATLVHPSSQFIWKSVRKAYPVPPPEPMSIFTEASYAAFLFGGGICENCEKPTRDMYRSFGIRLRLCRDHRCLAKFITDGKVVTTSVSLTHKDAVEKCLPHVETNVCFLPNPFVLARTRSKVFRALDWNREITDCANGRDDYLARHASDIKFTKAYMEFCEKLHDWHTLRQAFYRSNELANETFANALVEKHGWSYWDTLNSTPYGPLHRLRNQRVENVTQHDFDMIASDIEQALLKLTEDRTRKAQERLYAENRNAVAQHYQRLRSKQPQPILPSLPVFRRLPVVAMLQGSSPSTAGEGPSKVAHALMKEKFVIDRLQEQLKAWRAQAQKDLGAILGYSNWRSANTKVLHPVDRLTARFLCTVCSKVETKYRDEGSLDFAGACAHHCRGFKKRNKEDDAWKPESFVKDAKAIAALSKLLLLCNLEETSAEDNIAIVALGDTILCTSCESGIVLNPKSLIGHSHRHDNMQFRLLSPEQAATYLEYPSIPCLASTLGGPERRVKAARERVNFGCRHCLNAQRKKPVDEQPPQPQPRDSNATDKGLPRGRGPKKATLKFSFNGLSSHIKEKHGIDRVRDEDVYVFEAIDLKQLVASK